MKVRTVSTGIHTQFYRTQTVVLLLRQLTLALCQNPLLPTTNDIGEYSTASLPRRLPILRNNHRARHRSHARCERRCIQRHAHGAHLSL